MANCHALGEAIDGIQWIINYKVIAAGSLVIIECNDAAETYITEWFSHIYDVRYHQQHLHAFTVVL